MSRNKKTVIALVLLMIGGGAAWAFLPSGPDPQLVKVQQLQQKLFSPDSKLTDAERREGFSELRQEAEKLTPEQQGQLMRENPMAKRFQQTINDYFNAPEKERVAMLDKQIDQMEQWRKQREASGKGRPPGPPGGPGGPGGPRGGGGMDGNRENQMRKRMLDNTSPQQRAMFGQYFDDMNKRRQQRGLPPMGGPFGR